MGSIERNFAILSVFYEIRHLLREVVVPSVSGQRMVVVVATVVCDVPVGTKYRTDDHMCGVVDINRFLPVVGGVVVDDWTPEVVPNKNM